MPKIHPRSWLAGQYEAELWFALPQKPRPTKTESKIIYLLRHQTYLGKAHSTDCQISLCVHPGAYVHRREWTQF